MRVDLHCHSYFSDGLLSPHELVIHAKEVGIEILALTDHDTVSGLAELKNAVQNTSINVVYGIELSTSWKKYVIHIIGLNIQPEHALLQSLITQQNQSRIIRGQQMGECLERFGIKNAYQKACEIAGHERVGRPHFAELIVKEGLTADTKLAFKQYLIRGRPAYVPTQWADLETVVGTILAAGGEAVIAHPLKYQLTRAKLIELIILFKIFGGRGIEVISGEMNQLQIKDMVGICQRFSLLASSGSDFHGPKISRINLGMQQQLPPECTPVWQQWNGERQSS